MRTTTLAAVLALALSFAFSNVFAEDSVSPTNQAPAVQKVPKSGKHKKIKKSDKKVEQKTEVKQ